MAALYRTMVTAPACREALGTVLTLILSHDYDRGAMLWHCTAGKDRCGLVSALVLAALGVERAVILADYLLSNLAFTAEAEGLYQKVLASGHGEVTAAAARDVFLAKQAYLDAAIAAVEEAGGMEAYLEAGLGLSPTLLSDFRQRILC